MHPLEGPCQEAIHLCTQLFEHFLSPCTPRADTQAHVLIGWQLGTHAHYYVDTRTALGAAAWPLDLFPQWVTVIVVGGSGVAHALQNPMGSSQGNYSQRQDALPSTLSATTAFVL